MQPWKTSIICAGRYRPRQFEYHPYNEDVLVFGTLKGEAVVADVATNTVCSSIYSELAKDRHDSILGLCWLKNSPQRFVVGSSHGYLRLCDAGPLPTGRDRSIRKQAARAGRECGGIKEAATPQETSDNGGHGYSRRFEKRRSMNGDTDFGCRSEAVVEAQAAPFGSKASCCRTGGRSFGHGAGSGGRDGEAGGLDGRYPEGLSAAPVGKIVTEFEQFEKLTSVHVNSTDEHMLASGYTLGVRLFDLATGQVVRNFDKIHEDHINISRFANHSPFVFATSSFDRTVKAWDSRVRGDESPIYTCYSDLGHVMLSFSPDDVFLLTSAVDNEIKQYLAVDGKLHMNLDVPKTGLEENFTRSYYTSSGRLILSGSSEEQTVRLYCAQTGRLIHKAEMYPGRKHGSLYVQSLRGDPHHDFRFSVLVNYRDTAYPLEIVNVDMLRGCDGEDLKPLTAYASSSRLAADLGRACVDKEDADVSLVARDGSSFLAHKVVIACRSAVLEGLLGDAIMDAAPRPNASAAKKGASGDSKHVASHKSSLGGDASILAGEGTPEHASRKSEPDASHLTQTADLITVCLPKAVAPEVVPVVLEFLYTDQLETDPENGPDGHGRTYVAPPLQISPGRCLGKSWRSGEDPGDLNWRFKNHGDFLEQARFERGEDNIYPKQKEWNSGTAESKGEVLVCELVMEAAATLALRRLYTLVEWRCRELTDNGSVVAVTCMALRQGANQLLDYCVHYLSTHMQMVMELHGKDCIPPIIKRKLDHKQRERVYPLFRTFSNVPSSGDASASLGQPDSRGNLVFQPPSAPTSQAEASVSGPGQGTVGVGAVSAVLAAVEAAWALAVGNPGTRTATVDTQNGAAEAGQQVVDNNNNHDTVMDGMEDADDNDESSEASDVDFDDDGAFDVYVEEGQLVPPDEDGLVPVDDDQDDEESDDDIDDMDADMGEGDEQDNDADSFVDEEVEEEGHGSTSEDESATSDDDTDGSSVDSMHGGACFSGLLRRRLVPKVTGHTATAVLGSQMVVLGGGNKRQFHGCRHVPVYDPISRTWNKLSTRGTAPQALIYHSTTALEPLWAKPRNLLIFGGNSARHLPLQQPARAQVLVLDTLKMEWSKPMIEGVGAGIRTRHTAVAVHSDDDEFHRVHAENKPEDTLVSRFIGMSAVDVIMAAGDGASSDAYRRRRSRSRDGIGQHHQSERREYCCRDRGGDTAVVIFGGYSPPEAQAYNDVIVLMVRRSFGRSSVGGGGGSDNEANSRTYMGIRRRYSNGSRSVVDSESDNDDDDSIADDNDMESYRRNSRVGLCDNSRGHASIPRHQRWSFGSGGKKDSGSGRPSSQCKGSLHSSESGGRKRQDRQGVFGQGYEDIESHNGSRSNAGYRYRWVRPAVRGTPPDTRLAHAATVVRITEGEVGCGAGVSKETFMLVFGGVGTGALYNDIHMLRCGSISAMQWEPRVNVRGRPPSRRYGHSMITLNPSYSGNCSYAKVAVFGGTSGHCAFGDIFMLTISWGKVEGLSIFMADWECLTRKIGGFLPCPRSRQTMCQINGELLIFGGSDEAPVANDASHARSREVDTNVYHVRPRLKKRPLAECPAPSQAQRQLHERIMAREVARHIPAVLKLEQERAARRETMMLIASLESRARTRTFDLAKLQRASERMLGVKYPTLLLEAELEDSTPSGQDHEHNSPEIESPSTATGEGLGRAMVQAALASSSRPVNGTGGMGTSRGTALRPPVRRGWMNPRTFKIPQKYYSEEPANRPKWSYGVKIIWESVRPASFVHEAGPEPAVVVKPMTLHRDMQSLVGSKFFSDIQFRFQAVDYNEPTTPTNTAHYAIVPPPVSPVPPSTSAAFASTADSHTSSVYCEHFTPPRSSSPFGRSSGSKKVPAGNTRKAGGNGVMRNRPGDSDAAAAGRGLGEGSSSQFGTRRALKGASVASGTTEESELSNGDKMRASGDNCRVGAGERRNARHKHFRSFPSYSGTLSPRKASNHFKSAYSGSMTSGDSVVPSSAEPSRGKDSGGSVDSVTPEAKSSGFSEKRGAIVAFERPLSPLSPATRETSRDNPRSSIRTRSASHAATAGISGKCKPSNWPAGVYEVYPGGVPNPRTRTLLTRLPVQQERDSTSSPSREWTLIELPRDADVGTCGSGSSSSPLSSLSSNEHRGGTASNANHWDSAGSAGEKRRFFALSQPVDAGNSGILQEAGREGEQERSENERLDVAPAVGEIGSTNPVGGPCDRDTVTVDPVTCSFSKHDVINAHRVLLSLRSEPMRAMLRSGMKESFAADALVKDIRPPVFSALLTYLYTDTLQLERPEDIMELLVVANQYTLSDLVSLCEGFLQDVLDTDNAVQLYHYADALGMQTFERRVLTFILQHWCKISRSDSWKQLPPELRERANVFRTQSTHIFMLGHKDHVSWKDEGRAIADWARERAWADSNTWDGDDDDHIRCGRYDECSGGCSSASARKHRVGEGGETEEAWMTAAESEEGATSDDNATGEYFSPRSHSSADLSSL